MTRKLRETMLKLIRCYSKKPRLSKVKVADKTKALMSKPQRLYIPFSQFPKIPEQDEAESINIAQDYLKSHNKLIDFEIPKEHSKAYIKAQPTDKDRAMLEQLDNIMNANDESQIQQSQYNITKLYYDKDSFNYKTVPEHPLKRSISGMININPHLEDIDDAYLWDLIPENKLFGNPFFEKQDNTEKDFKNWEKSLINDNEKLRSTMELDTNEINKFLKKFNKNNKGFYHKVNGRYKLDRQLVKEYKRLNLKGKLSILNESPIDFDMEFEMANNNFKMKK